MIRREYLRIQYCQAAHVFSAAWLFIGLQSNGTACLGIGNCPSNSKRWKSCCFASAPSLQTKTHPRFHSCPQDLHPPRTRRVALDHRKSTPEKSPAVVPPCHPPPPQNTQARQFDPVPWMFALPAGLQLSFGNPSLGFGFESIQPGNLCRFSFPGTTLFCRIEDGELSANGFGPRDALGRTANCQRPTTAHPPPVRRKQNRSPRPSAVAQWWCWWRPGCRWNWCLALELKPKRLGAASTSLLHEAKLIVKRTFLLSSVFLLRRFASASIAVGAAVPQVLAVTNAWVQSPSKAWWSRSDPRQEPFAAEHGQSLALLLGRFVGGGEKVRLTGLPVPGRPSEGPEFKQCSVHSCHKHPVLAHTSEQADGKEESPSEGHVCIQEPKVESEQCQVSK